MAGFRCFWLTSDSICLCPPPPPQPPSTPKHTSDADIEAILQKGERDTADLNDKMNKFTESAKQFTMDGGLSLYDFKEEVRRYCTVVC